MYMRFLRIIDKCLVGFLLSGFLLSSAVIAQNPDDAKLVLRGTAIAPDRSFFQDEEEFHERKLLMEFVNRGSTPVILINPTLSYGTGLISTNFYYSVCDHESNTRDQVKGIVVYAKDHKPPVGYFRDFASSFDVDRPPANLTTILKPGKTFQFEETIIFPVDNPGPFKSMYPKVKGDVPKSLCRSSETPDHFRLEYEFSFLPYMEDPDFLEKLSFRWQKYGHLPVGTNGTYTFISEPIKYIGR